MRTMEQSMNMKLHEGVDDIIGKYYYLYHGNDSYELIPRLITNMMTNTFMIYHRPGQLSSSYGHIGSYST